MSDETRKHEFELILDAPADAVWRAISTGEGIRQWFAPIAEIDARLGGQFKIGWGPGMEGSAPLTVFEEGTRIGWTEDHGPRGQRIVEFTIESLGGQTRLRLVQSGFGADASFDNEFESTNGGWRTFLACLRYYVEVMRNASGRHECRMAMLTTSASDLWSRLTAEMGLAQQDWTPGAPYRAFIPDGGQLSGIVVDSPKQRYAILRCDELDGSLLALFCENFGGACALTASWYLYGSGLAPNAPLLADWNRYFDLLAAPQGSPS